MDHEQAAAPPASLRGRRGIWGWWTATPLYLRIIGALILGALTGVALGSDAALLAIPAKVILRLSAIARRSFCLQSFAPSLIPR
jgi:hypothetical protein